MKSSERTKLSSLTDRLSSKRKAGFVQFGEQPKQVVDTTKTVAVNLKPSLITRLRARVRKLTATKQGKAATASAIVILLALVGGAWFALSREEPVTPNEKPVSGARNAEEFIAIENNNANTSDADESAKIRRKVQAANYYTNSYQFEKLITELDKIKQQHPAAEQNHFYMTSYFTALFELDRKAEMKTYAKKIIELEGKGIRDEIEVSPGIRDAINANAQ